MSTQAVDVARTLEYGRGRVAPKVLGIALLFLGTGGILLYAGKNELVGGAGVLFGLLLVFLQMRHMTSGEPLLRLSLAGARLNLDGKVFLDVLWDEVSEVTALDVSEQLTRPTTGLERMLRPRSGGKYFVTTERIARNGVTALHVSEQFYDQAIKPKLVLVRKGAGLFNIGAGMAYLIRSPGSMWRSGLGNIFVLRDGKRYVLLHHSMLPASREALRAAVEERWLAFRGKAPAAARN